VVGAGAGPGPERPFPVPKHRDPEAGHGGPQRLRGLLDATPAATVGQSFGLVDGDREGFLGEEALQRPGQRAHGAARTSGAFQQRLRRTGRVALEGNRPSAVIIVQVRPTQCREAR